MTSWDLQTTVHFLFVCFNLRQADEMKHSANPLRRHSGICNEEKAQQALVESIRSTWTGKYSEIDEILHVCSRDFHHRGPNSLDICAMKEIDVHLYRIICEKRRAVLPNFFWRNPCWLKVDNYRKVDFVRLLFWKLFIFSLFVNFQNVESLCFKVHI